MGLGPGGGFDPRLFRFKVTTLGKLFTHVPLPPSTIFGTGQSRRCPAWWQRHVCKQLAQGCYLKAEQPGIEPTTMPETHARITSFFVSTLQIWSKIFDQILKRILSRQNLSRNPTPISSRRNERREQADLALTRLNAHFHHRAIDRLKHHCARRHRWLKPDAASGQPSTVTHSSISHVYASVVSPCHSGPTADHPRSNALLSSTASTTHLPLPVYCNPI